MADRSNYADKPSIDSGGLQEHTLNLGGPRRYDPDGGASAGEGAKMSTMTDDCMGDWSWKPYRDRALGYDTFEKKCAFVTFLGVPPGGAELSHRSRNA